MPSLTFHELPGGSHVRPGIAIAKKQISLAPGDVSEAPNKRDEKTDQAKAGRKIRKIFRAGSFSPRGGSPTGSIGGCGVKIVVTTTKIASN